MVEVRVGRLFAGCTIYCYKVSSEAAPFADNTPIAVATKVPLGERPKRSRHPILTNNLWALAVCCLGESPRRRPDITAVIDCLRGDSARKQHHVGVADMLHADDMDLGSTLECLPLHRASFFISP